MVLTAIQYFSKVDSVETASIVQRSLQGSSPLVRTFQAHIIWAQQVASSHTMFSKADSVERASVVQRFLQGSSPLVRTFHTNSDEQAQCGCKFFFNMSILCGRRVLTAMQYFSKVDSVETASIVQRSLQDSSPLVRTFILHTFLERRGVIPGIQIYTTADIGAIKIIHHLIFEGMRIGEAAHPGPRLRRRGPRSLESHAARRNREGPASVIQESQVDNCENGLLMLHLNLRGYLSHIAETTAMLRGMEQKPFLVTLNA